MNLRIYKGQVSKLGRCFAFKKNERFRNKKSKPEESKLAKKHSRTKSEQPVIKKSH